MSDTYGNGQPIFNGIKTVGNIELLGSQSITSTANGNISITPNGTGDVLINTHSTLEWDTIAIGQGAPGSAPPADEHLVQATNGVAYCRAFDGTTPEDLIFNWPVPKDCDVSAGIKYLVQGVATSATPPASGEGCCYELSGYCSNPAAGGGLNGTYGTAVASKNTDLYAAGTATQNDWFETALSSTVTITDVIAGGQTQLYFRRNTADSADDYGQDLETAYLHIQWTKKTVKVT